MKHDEYFRAIGMNQIEAGRAYDVLEIMRETLNIETDNIIICDLMKNDERSYTSLWVSSGNFICEAKNFLTSLVIDKARMRGVHHLEFRFDDCKPNDFSNIEKARVFASFAVLDGVTGEINGIKANSQYVYNFVRNNILAYCDYVLDVSK